MDKRKINLAVKDKKVKRNLARRKEKRLKKTADPNAARDENRRRNDIRAQKPDESVTKVSNQAESIPIQVEIPSPNWAYIASSIVIKALERGWLGASNLSSDAYYAMGFLNDLFQLYAKGGTPPAVNLPYYILAICRAIQGKSVKFNSTGGVSYQNFIPVIAQVPTGTFPIGPTPFSPKFNFYTPSTGAAISGFPVGQPPAAYDPALGLAAFQSLTTFMSDKGVDHPELVSVPMDTKTSLDKDVSAFAITTQSQGGGAAGNAAGGWSSILYNEVPIFRPFVSLIGTRSSTSQVTQATGRFYRFDTTFAGDPWFVGGMMGFELKEKQWTMKRMPKLHCVDFYEFAEVLALYVQNLVQSLIDDNQALNSFNPLNLSKITCPLTLQDLLIALRGVMMHAFKNTQAAVQALYPQEVAAGNTFAFQAFLASATTYTAGNVALQLPTPFLENIYALTVKHMDRHPQSDPEFFIPVLGMYRGTALASDDYKVTYMDQNGVEQSANVFKTGAIYKKSTWDEKKKIYIHENLVEVPIDLVDGTAGGQFLFINDTTRLAEISRVYNTWLSQSGVASYSVSTSTLATESGVGALASIGMTRHFYVKPAETVQPKVIVVDTRESFNIRSIAASPYLDKLAVADTSTNSFAAPLYEPIQSLWILPTNNIAVIVNSDDDTLVPRWQTMMTEPYRVTLFTGNVGRSLTQMHGVYAAKLIKSKLSETNDWMDVFNNLSKRGEGGLLSGLVNSFVKSAFPGVAPISDLIADVIPF